LKLHWNDMIFKNQKDLVIYSLESLWIPRSNNLAWRSTQLWARHWQHTERSVHHKPAFQYYLLSSSPENIRVIQVLSSASSLQMPAPGSASHHLPQSCHGQQTSCLAHRRPVLHVLSTHWEYLLCLLTSVIWLTLMPRSSA